MSTVALRPKSVPRCQSARGLALATTLLVVFMILCFGLTLATLSCFQYQFTNQAVNRGRAFEAAQAGLNQAIYNLTDQSTWGLNKESLNGSVAADQSTYSVTFDKTLGQPYSTNNLANAASVPGYQGQAVPGFCAMLMVQGRCPNSSGGGLDTRTYQALVQYAAYPYAVAASNTVSCSGPLTVNGSGNLSQLLSGSASQPGNVYGGSSSSSAVSGGSGSNVSGKVRTPGDAVFGSFSTIVGGIDSGIQPETLPDINISSYNNQNFPNVTVLSPGGTYVLINGPTYVNGNITLLAGVLNNAYLYVDGGGNFTSLLGLTGTGSIFVTGNTHLEGLATLMLNSGIAVFSEGDLTVSGGTFFQGVVYSHGNITAANGVNVVGAVIAQNSAGTSNVQISSGANVTYVPDFTQFGSSMSSNNMMGHLVNGANPLMKVVFWREVP